MDLDSNKTSDVTFATVPRFVRTVYDMLQNEDQRIISWSADGSHFQVYDVPRLETEVLHKYFKHGKFSSFQRQLNNFGFHKWTKTRASVATFSHEVLVRCHPSQLAVLVGQMKLKQKAVAVMTSAPVKPTTSMKRPRNLLGYTTEITTLTKKHKMSPRDVCAIDELSDVGFASFVDLPWLMEDDSCGFNDDLLLGVVDSVDLAELDWDAFAASLDFCNGDNDNNSNSHSSTIAFDADMDLCFDVHSDASIAVLTEDDLCADLGGLDTIPSLTDCETELRPPNDSPVTLTTNHYNINQSNVTMNLDSNKTSDVTFATVPRFVRTVYDMLQNEDQRIISWSADGSHFQVYDVPRLETEVLHKYFKHGKFSSFQRQLNNFGFHKWTKTRASVATFSHEVLVRCHPSQLAVLVGQMKLKQKAVAVMTSAPVKPTTSMKRPRNLLGYTTEITTLTKKHKMSPRDVCAIDELSDVGFASFVDLPWLMEDDSCGFNDDLLLGVVDSVDLAELDWDAFAASLDFCNGDNDNNSNSHSSTIAFDADMDLCFDVHSDASIAVLTEDDLCADLGGLDTIPSLTDCETELRPPNDSPVTLTTNHYNINQSNVTMNLDSNKTSDVTFATVPRFVRTVYDMLQNEDQRIISWSADGSHFQVYDVPRLETEVLHKYFKHGKFSSFQRQLNNFGFHKWTKTRASVATFSHEKAVAVMTSAPVKPTTSMKRPRNLLGYTTEITTLTKKHKMSPRDVCAIDELSDVGFASFVDLPWLMEDDSCGFNDDLLLGVVDSVDLAELDWDAFAASLDFCNGDNDNNSNSHSSTIAFDADMDLCFDVHSDASIAVLTEDDLCADLGGLDTIPSLTDCETELVLGSSSFRYQR
ncbi:HSF-type DNA-binding [Phytophthora infestans]|uniref:HSF-type DNA-binding n=1 Tax=Phytophthora infestans TaxID=4787 RepID=A0A833WNH1_PHYIN|nr:HSF-type DNA-binding [Phytophthora infestans]